MIMGKEIRIILCGGSGAACLKAPPASHLISYVFLRPSVSVAMSVATAMPMSVRRMGTGFTLKMPITSTRRRTSTNMNINIGQVSSSFLKGFTLFPPCFPSIRTRKSVAVPVVARKVLEGTVVCATNDKTVRVEVFRLAVHPKYKKRVKVKKNYQAHDPANTFKVGDRVQLQKCRPISKTKAFLALPVPPRNSTRAQPQQLSLPLQSHSSAPT